MKYENPGERHRNIEICPDAESGLVLGNPEVKCGEIRAIATGIYKFVRMRNPDLSGKSGCEMRRNPGNHIRDIEICSDAKSGFVRKIRM